MSDSDKQMWHNGLKIQEHLRDVPKVTYCTLKKKILFIVFLRDMRGWRARVKTMNGLAWSGLDFFSANTRYSCSALCCSISTVSAEVMHPEREEVIVQIYAKDRLRTRYS